MVPAVLSPLQHTPLALLLHSDILEPVWIPSTPTPETGGPISGSGSYTSLSPSPEFHIPTMYSPHPS